MATRTDAEKRADKNYDDKTFKKPFRLNPDKYQDVIDHLNKQPNFTQYIVGLIEKDMESKKG